MVGAIIILGPDVPVAMHSLKPAVVAGNNFGQIGDSALGTPLTCTAILGRSVVERTVDELKRVGVERITVLADHTFAAHRLEIDRGFGELSVQWVGDAWTSAAQVAKRYEQSGIDWTFIFRASEYAEVDLLGMLHFHRSRSQGVTRAWSDREPLSIWLLDTNRLSASSVQEPAGEMERYQVSGYVNRLASASDFRKLVVDGLSSRCKLRPRGTEVRAGVWIEPGAQIHKKARIVGPAFIGKGAKIGEQCLITRCSNVESNCEIDYGTIVEDSSILADTYVGIGLDVAHSIIRGETLLNLQRDVKLEIADPGMIRRTKVYQREWNRRPGSFAASDEMFVPQRQ